MDSKFQNRHSDSRKNKDKSALSLERNLFSVNTSLDKQKKLQAAQKEETDPTEKKFAVLAQSIKQRIEASTQNTYYNKRDKDTNKSHTRNIHN